MILEINKGDFGKRLDEIVLAIAEETMKHEVTFISVTREKPSSKMTDKQRGSLHVWVKQVGVVLNEAGETFAVRSKFNGGVETVDWDGYLVKEYIYKPLLKAMSGKDSTEKQDTVQPSQVALEITRHFANKGIVLPPWPSNR